MDVSRKSQSAAPAALVALMVLAGLVLDGGAAGADHFAVPRLDEAMYIDIKVLYIYMYP